MTNCIEQPTDAEIREELVSLPGGDQVSSVELRVTKTHYMAMAGSVREGFYARYEEFSEAGRWEATNHELSLDLATRILSEYRDGTETWHSLTMWQRCSIKPLLNKR